MGKKKIKTKSIVFIIIFFLLATGAFFYFKSKRAIEFFLPDISKVSFLKAQIKNDTAHLKIKTVLQNKSFYKLTIDSLFCEIKLADTTIVKEKIFVGLKQQKGEIDTIELPVKLAIKKIKETMHEIQGTDSTYFDFDYYVVYNTIFGATKLPFTKRIETVTPVPPKIRIVTIDRNKTNLIDKTIDIVLHLEVSNQGKLLNIMLKNVNYDINIENLVLSKGKLLDELEVKPQTTTTLEIPLKVKVNKLLKTGWLIADNKDRLSYNLSLDGELETQRFIFRKIPFLVNIKGETELKK